MHHDVIIIGAGAAGLMCARHAARRKRRVLVLERAERIGKKILISGGGRCNFTNVNVAPANYLSNNPRFCISALSRYKPKDFLDLVHHHGIAYHEKKLGQLFCDHSAKDIVKMLQNECEDAGVILRVSCSVADIAKTQEGFTVKTLETSYTCNSLVIATGGLSFPKLGATDFGYTLAKRFGLSVIACRPGLVPLTFHEEDAKRYADLTGISANCVASTGKTSFAEDFLFTHRGVSGPAILQVSSYWREGDAVTLDLTPGRDVRKELLARKQEGEKTELKNVLAELFVQRLANRLCELYLPSKPLNQCADKDLIRLAETLKRFKIVPQETEGYAKAEVTLGGVDTRALSSKTMECHAVPGLYFIGEVVDVTGHLGGYNFQWAWASGAVAGESV